MRRFALRIRRRAHRRHPCGLRPRAGQVRLSDEAWVGVLRVVLAVPGARTLKDRRQVVRSLRDRVRARFDVTCNELPGENPGRQSLLLTTGGSSAHQVREALDAVARLLYETRDAWPVTVDIDVQRWQPPEPRLPALSPEDPDG